MRAFQHFIKVKAIFVSLVFINLLMVSETLCVELSLYVDGSPAPEGMAFAGYEPLPTLGIHSDNTGGWHGYVLSSDFTLSNGQIDYSKIPLGNTSITPYEEPYGYEMITDGFVCSGIQFMADMNPDEYWSLITLWDASSAFDVPVDTLYIWRGGHPGFESAAVQADAGGPYELAEAESVMFDATDSICTFWIDDGQGGYYSYTTNVGGNHNLAYWSINGVDIAFGLTPTISYDTLVNGLGLGLGIYDLTLDLTVPIVGYDTTTTTIEIIPEPSTLLLLGLGAVMLRRRK